MLNYLDWFIASKSVRSLSISSCCFKSPSSSKILGLQPGSDLFELADSGSDPDLKTGLDLNRIDLSSVVLKLKSYA